MTPETAQFIGKANASKNAARVTEFWMHPHHISSATRASSDMRL